MKLFDGSCFPSLLMKEKNNIPRNTPLLSTYKRRASPPHSNNTQGIKSYTTRISASFKGLMP
jgi:hypothetical protein